MASRSRVWQIGGVPRRLRHLLLAACALLACAVAAPAALAADRRAPEGFLGVVADRAALDGRVPLERHLRRMAANGAEAVGLAFPWLHVEAEPGTLDFSELDARVRAAVRAGLDVHPVVIAAPMWARLHPRLEFSPPADPAAYAAFAAALVRRYGPGGAFWAANPALPARPIRAWQIWNEPVGGDGDDTPSVFWQDDERFDVRYVPLLRAAHAAIKAEDPRATVVLGALVGHSWQTLDLIYGAGARGSFDAVALHPYTADAPNVVRIVRLVRRTMRKHGDGALPIHITELGWPAFDARSVKRLGVRRANRAQAGWLRAAITELTRQRQRLGIDLILWYTWIGRDRSGRDAFDHSGLLRLEPSGRLVPKPALRAFRSVARWIAGGASRSR
jgi:hypothetical protein